MSYQCHCCAVRNTGSIYPICCKNKQLPLSMRTQNNDLMGGCLTSTENAKFPSSTCLITFVSSKWKSCTKKDCLYNKMVAKLPAWVVWYPRFHTTAFMALGFPQAMLCNPCFNWEETPTSIACLTNISIFIHDTPTNYTISKSLQFLSNHII